jgi:signal transduction histidine kinase
MADEGKGEADELRRLLHDFNQPLTAIGNYAQAGCQMIDQGMNDPARLRALFEKIAQQGSRASALTRELGQAIGGTAQSSR